MDTETGALSVEDAVARLSAEEAVDDQPQPEAEAQPEIDEPAEEPAIEETDDGETEVQDDEPAEDEAQLEPIAPPKSWDAEHGEKFAQLPRELQEYVSQREAERDRGANIANQRLAEARQRAEQEAAQITALKPQIESSLAQAQELIQTRWSGMDATAWAELARSDPGRYVAEKAAFEADVQRAQQLDAARQQAEAVEYQTFSQVQTARLAEVAPHLASDPKLQAEVFDYIGKSVPSMTPDQSRWISADEFSIAWKAMQYDRAQAPTPKPQGKKAIPAKPSAPPIPQAQRHRSQAAAAFQKAPTIENAMRLLS